jgi:hypothetical protein
MSNPSMTFGRPSRVVNPRGSSLLVGFAGLLIDGLRRLDRWQLSLQRDEPRTAAEVYAWANRIERTDPGFAADLRSAALRSEAEEQTRHNPH